MVAAHKAAAQSRKVHEMTDGKVERKRVLVPKKLSQAQGNGGEYLRVQRIPECFIPPQEKMNVHNVIKFLKAYKIQQAPADHPGYSWLELLICFELHGMKLEMEEAQEECHAKPGTQAHIQKFRDVVAFIFLHGTTGAQQQLYRAGQPKKLRLKECGVMHAVPCVSFLAVWPPALAEEVQVGVMRQAGRLSKCDEVKLRAGTYEVELGQLNPKGLPRWRRKHDRQFEIADTMEVSEPHADRVLICNNIFRKLRCPGCGLWTETAGQQPRQCHDDLRNPWRNLKCSHCKRIRNANGWHCTCGVLWFKCPTHSAAHLDGHKPKRIGDQHISEPHCKTPKVSNLELSALPEPQVRAIRVRSRPAEMAPLPEVELNVQPVKRFRLSLPPVLKLRFPHLAE